MAKKIVLVTAGGHISSFHAAMKRMHEVLDAEANGKYELLGARGGLEGLINGTFEPVRYEDLEEDKAGSLIGADRKTADAEKIVRVVKDNDIYAIVMMGGDDHLKELKKCYDAGLNVVGYPKTMDGDLSSLITCGWETAVTAGAMHARYHHNTAMTNRRVFYVGLFGRNTDWVLCPATLYGGGDVGIPCEEEYDWDYVWGKIDAAVKRNSERYGIKFAVVPYSEGAKINGINPPPEDYASYDAHKRPKLQPEWLGMELVRKTQDKGMGACFQSYTYSLRDTPPTETDKALSRMAGEGCIRMVLEHDFGKAVVFEPDGEGFFRTGRAPLEQAAVQRTLRNTGFFDYSELVPTLRFAEVYGNLFRRSLGMPPAKDQLVYRNMLRRA